MWQVTRLRVVRGLAAHVHAIDPVAAQLIPAGLMPAKTTRRIPYLYSGDQIENLMSKAATLSPPPEPTCSGERVRPRRRSRPTHGPSA